MSLEIKTFGNLSKPLLVWFLNYRCISKILMIHTLLLEQKKRGNPRSYAQLNV